MKTIYLLCIYFACATSMFAQRGLYADANQEWSLRFLESLPEFEDGEESLIRYIQTNAIYTERAIADKAIGRIYIKFFVDETGKVLSPVIQKSLHPDLDSIVMTMVTTMPLWKPAIERGKPVKCPYTLVVNFDFKGRGTPENPVPAYYWREIGKRKFVNIGLNKYGKDSLEIESYFKYVIWNFNGLRIDQIDLNQIFAMVLP